jgi:DsbC/DsbD-like thiol-disulfide interchange protein
MAIMLRTASAVIFLILSIFSAFGQPLTSSRSGQGDHSRVRLISGGRHADQWLAGIEITLTDGFKTYWRNPGESGLPPRFDWSGSENVASTDVRWPAPSRHEDAAGVAFIYSKKVVLPVLVKAAEPDKPVKLAVSIDYGICKDICIPAHEELTATLSGEGPDRAAIEEALAKVPRPQALGAQADLSVLAVEPLTQDKPGLSVTIRAPEGSKPALFAEAPENWYVSTSLPDAGNRFTVTVDEKPKDASGPVPLRLTLTAGDKAVETEVSLDGNGQSR